MIASLPVSLGQRLANAKAREQAAFDAALALSRKLREEDKDGSYAHAFDRSRESFELASAREETAAIEAEIAREQLAANPRRFVFGDCEENVRHSAALGAFNIAAARHSIAVRRLGTHPYWAVKAKLDKQA